MRKYTSYEKAYAEIKVTKFYFHFYSIFYLFIHLLVRLSETEELTTSKDLRIRGRIHIQVWVYPKLNRRRVLEYALFHFPYKWLD